MGYKLFMNFMMEFRVCEKDVLSVTFASLVNLSVSLNFLRNAQTIFVVCETHFVSTVRFTACLVEYFRVSA